MARGQTYSEASLGVSGVLLGLVAITNPYTAAGIALAGIASKLADSEYTAVNGESVGESLARQANAESKPTSSEKKGEEDKSQTTTSGTTADAASASGTDDADSGDSSDSDSSSSSSSTNESSQSKEAGESRPAESRDDGKSESGADPEVAATYRYRPSMDEVRRQFGSSSIQTTARSNPNPTDDGAAAYGVPVEARTLTGTADARVVNPDGRAARGGTAGPFGATHMQGLGTIRPADTGGGEGVGRPQTGTNPVA